MPRPYDVLHESANICYNEPHHSELGRKAWKSASRAAKHMSKHSKIVNPKLEKCIPRFEQEEIVIGKLLGSGGFNHVYELERLDLYENPFAAEHARKITSDLQQEHRSFIAKHAYRESTDNCRYAIKFLSQETLQDPDRFCTGAADLVVEAKFLASLEHPNIIKLRGMAAAGTSGFASCTNSGYFLILDRLQATLDDKIEEWKDTEQRMNNAILARKLVDRAGKKQRELLAQRLHVAFDVASALQYLHDNNIIYRDLKPDNIGFDIRGDVKLFDFGLAKELDESLKSGSLTEYYELSGNTGSLRYMAPEVALCEPYNLAADVYSFGLLLWQVCSLNLPYDGMTRSDHANFVVKGNERPPLESTWSTPLRILMKRAWEPDPSVRPSMDSIYKILKREICALRDGDDTGLENVRRRSTFVLNKESAANPVNTRNNSTGRRRSLGEKVQSSRNFRIQSRDAGMRRSSSLEPKVTTIPSNSRRHLMKTSVLERGPTQATPMAA